MASVTLKNIVKKYGDIQVVHGVDLTIELAKIAKRDNLSMLIVGQSESIMKKATHKIGLLSGNNTIKYAVGPPFSNTDALHSCDLLSNY